MAAAEANMTAEPNVSAAEATMAVEANMVVAELNVAAEHSLHDLYLGQRLKSLSEVEAALQQGPPEAVILDATRDQWEDLLDVSFYVCGIWSCDEQNRFVFEGNGFLIGSGWILHIPAQDESCATSVDKLEFRFRGGTVPKRNGRVAIFGYFNNPGAAAAPIALMRISAEEIYDVSIIRSSVTRHRGLCALVELGDFPCDDAQEVFSIFYASDNTLYFASGRFIHTARSGCPIFCYVQVDGKSKLIVNLAGARLDSPSHGLSLYINGNSWLSVAIDIMLHVKAINRLCGMKVRDALIETLLNRLDTACSEYKVRIHLPINADFAHLQQPPNVTFV